ncbi:cytochrome P450 [Periconia macrospinosa]|uniref:Cytochrome P450 n=1 Tax=Periconia macrospinosa TaxID=97972 RepID=A0A2V1DQR7_9PLEO|nr:cytochrome P450 [Periconia macrospinosa]
MALAFIFDLTYYSLLLGAIALLTLYTLSRFGRRGKYLPPGPPTLPFLGNAHQIPLKDFDRKIKQWSDQYGTVFSLKIGNGTLIVLNDREAIHELIDKKSRDFNDRGFDHHVFGTFGDIATVVMHATPIWRNQRKIAAQMMTAKTLDGEMPDIRDAEVISLMYELLADPVNFNGHIKRSIASSATIVIWGHRAKDLADFWATCGHTGDKTMNDAMVPGSYIPTDQLPILDLIPKSRAAFKKLWEEARGIVDRRRASGDKRDSIIDRVLSGNIQLDVAMSDDGINCMCGTFNIGASSTTTSSVLSSVLFLAKYPEFQDKAQEELDSVCGDSRMPVWEDFEKLPYINCIVKEALRIRPAAPLGVPHRAARDTWYKGMLIPKHAAIMIPAQPLHNDSTYYPNPTVYNPSRFLQHPRLASHYANSPD